MPRSARSSVLDSWRALLGGLALFCVLAGGAGAEDVAERYRLLGVIAGSAAVEDLETGRQMAVKPGGMLGDWKVESVSIADMVLTRGGERLTMRRSTSEGAAPRDEPAAPQPGTKSPDSEAPAGSDPDLSRAELQVIAGEVAYFSVQPGGGSLRRRAGEMLDADWKVIEVGEKEIRLDGKEGQETLGLGQSVRLTPVPSRAAARGTPVGPAAEVVFLGSFGKKAIFELASPSGRRQVICSVGEALRPGLLLTEFDTESATLEDRGAPGSAPLRLARSPRQVPSYSADLAVSTGEETPAYPWRVPLWERNLRQLLGETRLTLRLTARDLDESVKILRQQYGLPIVIDPDVFEELPDHEFIASLNALDLPADKVVDQLISGKPLVAEPAFGQLVVGLARNLLPIAERRQRRDEISTEMQQLRRALASMPAVPNSRLKEKQEETLRFTQHELPADTKTLGQLLKVLGTELGMMSTVAASADLLTGARTDDTNISSELPIPVKPGRRSLRDHLVDALAEHELAYRFSGNIMRIVSQGDAVVLDEKEEATRREYDALHKSLLEFPRDLPLGVKAPLVGPLWFIAQSVSAAGAVEIIPDAPAWRNRASLQLPADATLGQLLDLLTVTRSLIAVRGSDDRIYILTP